jgi:hypothetical protein
MSDPFDDDPRQDQLRLGHIYGRFQQHDFAALRRLTADELAEQVRARQALADYFVELYEWVKYGLGVPHPFETPEYAAVAGMADLANSMTGNARIVTDEQRNLGN